MPRYTTSPVLPYRAEDLFELVSDIGRYPEFIKWIQTMAVSGERTSPDGIRHAHGDARVGFRGFSERFATAVRADEAAGTVEASLVRGPFRKLANRWTFVPLESGATRVDFEIDYAFSNPILAMLARANFGLAVNRIMAAFTEEAGRRYQKTA
ncbi:MAG: type II toxin-antitoxin system RatA family toxin [Pseudomonadota bacterium]